MGRPRLNRPEAEIKAMMSAKSLRHYYKKQGKTKDEADKQNQEKRKAKDETTRLNQTKQALIKKIRLLDNLPILEQLTEHINETQASDD